jgi:hypothetical protein
MTVSSSGLHPKIDEDFQLVKDAEIVVIRRREKGKFYRGKWVGSNRFQEWEARASFQPVSGRETLQLPEGDREKVHVKVYTDFAVKRDDIIERKDEQYEVQVLNNWGTFTKAIARLIDVERR